MVRHLAARTGFTLVQLLLIIALLLLLFAFLLPVVARVRHAAGDAQSQNNLRQLAIACHNYNDVFRRLPPTCGKGAGAIGGGNVIGTCHFHLLPYLEQSDLYKKAEGAVWKNGVYGVVLPLFIDDRDKSGGAEHKFNDWLATTNYAANWLVFKTGENRIPASFPDGTSNTLIFAERYQICNDTPTAWG